MTSDPAAPEPDPLLRRASWAVALVAAVVFAPSLFTGFAADDFFILSRLKTHGGLAHPLGYFGFEFFQYYRPVAFLSHAVDWQIWGLNPFGFHLTNLLLHAGSAVLVLLIGRRLVSAWAALTGALLFGLHPASHEAVYWIAARFDLMATFFTLAAIWCLAHERQGWQAAGLAAFALALLSKESAISALLIVPAWDVFIAKRRAGAVIRRLLPVLVVAVAYAMLRTFGADLDAAGGSRRLPKLIAMAVVLLGVLLIAWARDRKVPAELRLSWAAAAALAGVFAGLLWWPATTAAAARALGFVAYAAFHLVSPIVFPSPSPEWFSPSTVRDAVPGLLTACLALGILAGWRHAIARHAGATFLCLFVVAALIPVSSMAGGLRYLYLASAGVSLFTAWALDQAPRGARRVAVPAVVIIVALVSTTQLMHAGRAWRAGSDMTHDGIVLMSSALAPCGSKDLVLFTTPVGIGGVYANFYYEAFDVLTGCSPKSFSTLLRIVGEDVHVDVAAPEAGLIELRVPDYQGNIVASTDLSTFDVGVPPGLSRTLQTAIGPLEISAEGSTQIFRLRLSEALHGAARFYYSDGRIRGFPATAGGVH